VGCFWCLIVFGVQCFSVNFFWVCSSSYRGFRAIFCSVMDGKRLCKCSLIFMVVLDSNSVGSWVK